MLLKTRGVGSIHYGLLRHRPARAVVSIPSDPKPPRYSRQTYNYSVANGFYVTRGYINAVVEVRGTIDTYGPGGKGVALVNFGPRQTKDGVALVHWAAHELPGSNWDRGSGRLLISGNRPDLHCGRPWAQFGSQGDSASVRLERLQQLLRRWNTQPGCGALCESPLAKTLTGTRNEAVNYASSLALEHQILAGGPEAYNGTYWQDRTTFTVAPKIVRNNIPALLWSGWDKIAFTGSTAAGRRVASLCGERIARCTLELGGKSAAIVLDDVDIASTAASLASAECMLTWQVCYSLTRVLG